MKIVVEISSFDNLLETCWGQAIDSLKLVDKYGLQDELMEQLEELFGDYCEEPYSDTQLNDYLAYELDEYNFIAEHIDIDDIDDIDELEQYVKDLGSYEAKATITDFKTADKEELLWQYIQNNYDGYNLLEVMKELEGFESACEFKVEEE